MDTNKIVNREIKHLTPELTVLWLWYDRIDENPYYRLGTDENPPHCGTYLNGKLVTTVQWRFDVEAKTITRFLETTPDKYQRMPGWSPMPLELPNG